MNSEPHQKSKPMTKTIPDSEPPASGKEKGIRYGHIKNLWESHGHRIIQSNIESLGNGIFRWTITSEEK